MLPCFFSCHVRSQYEDIMQLEWLSTFVEDSFSGGGLTLGKESLCSNKEPSSNQFQISSPISVLESSSSSSTSSSDIKTIPLSPSHRGPQRARSKRPRPANFNPRAAISTFIDTPGFSSQSENLVKPSPVDKIPELAGTQQQKKKRRKIKKTLPAVDLDDNSPPNPSTEGIRKCMHCEITKTPQWRAGPMGPKSLCNACGVRYKSGRLFPEYRPAASPTFVPALHSNSHKKVIEMRTKTVPTSEATPPATANPEIVPKVE